MKITLSIDFADLPSELKNEIYESSAEMIFEPGSELLREGQYIKVVPVVIDGLIKVISKHETKEVLLYYIKPGESCVMSFGAGIKDEPSKMFAIAEQETTIIAMPIDKVKEWIEKYAEFNLFFYKVFDQRYIELVEAIKQIVFYKMDNRVLNYLRDLSELTGENPLKISHRQIADDLGTAREVVSRTIKKLENDGLLHQENNTVEII